MKKITAELLPLGALTEEDVRDFVTWVQGLRHVNNFDPEVMFYDRTAMCRSLADGVPELYLPIQPVLMYESLAPRPGLSKRHIAMGLYRIGELMDTACQQLGFGEQYFITNDPDEVAAVCKRGWSVCLHDKEKGEWLMKKRTPRPEEPEKANTEGI